VRAKAEWLSYSTIPVLGSQIRLKRLQYSHVRGFVGQQIKEDQTRRTICQISVFTGAENVVQSFGFTMDDLDRVLEMMTAKELQYLLCHVKISLDDKHSLAQHDLASCARECASLKSISFREQLRWPVSVSLGPCWLIALNPQLLLDAAYSE
jgi:hypothetical protein